MNRKLFIRFVNRFESSVIDFSITTCGVYVCPGAAKRINNAGAANAKKILACTASRCRRAYILPLLFFLRVSFFLSLFRRLISEVTEQILTKLGYIFIYDCYLKNFVRTPPAFTPDGLGAKTLIWDRL